MTDIENRDGNGSGSGNGNGTSGNKSGTSRTTRGKAKDEMPIAYVRHRVSGTSLWKDMVLLCSGIVTMAIDE